MNIRNDPFRESNTKTASAGATETFSALIARISSGFYADFGGVRAASAARTIGRACASDAESPLAAAKTGTSEHVGIQARHVRPVALVFAIPSNEVARANATGQIARFASGIASAIATNAVGAEEARCAILNDIALQALTAGGATISTAIDIGFVTALNVVITAEARIRFWIAENATLAAISVGIAFDAITFTIARVPAARRTCRTLRRRGFYFHARRTGGHVAIVFGRVHIVIDGFFTALPVALHFFAIAGYLRLQFLPIGRRRLAANFFEVASPGQTRCGNTTLIARGASAAFTSSGADQVIVETTRKPGRENVGIRLTFTTFERTRIAIIRGWRARTLQ